MDAEGCREALPGAGSGHHSTFRHRRDAFPGGARKTVDFHWDPQIIGEGTYSGLIVYDREFDDSFGWGYNPAYMMAVDKYYGPADDPKAFINAAHEQGIAVIFDLMLNHAMGQHPLIKLFTLGDGLVTKGGEVKVTHMGFLGQVYNNEGISPRKVGVPNYIGELTVLDPVTGEKQFHFEDADDRIFNDIVFRVSGLALTSETFQSQPPAFSSNKEASGNYERRIANSSVETNPGSRLRTQRCRFGNIYHTPLSPLAMKQAHGQPARGWIHGKHQLSPHPSRGGNNGFSAVRSRGALRYPDHQLYQPYRNAVRRYRPQGPEGRRHPVFQGR